MAIIKSNLTCSNFKSYKPGLQGNICTTGKRHPIVSQIQKQAKVRCVQQILKKSVYLTGCQLTPPKKTTWSQRRSHDISCLWWGTTSWAWIQTTWSTWICHGYVYGNCCVVEGVISDTLNVLDTSISTHNPCSAIMYLITLHADHYWTGGIYY